MKHGTIVRNYLFLFLLYQFCIFINIGRILLNEAWNNRKKFSLFVSLVPVLYIYYH